jgi:hypothetical protein
MWRHVCGSYVTRALISLGINIFKWWLRSLAKSERRIDIDIFIEYYETCVCTCMLTSIKKGITLTPTPSSSIEYLTHLSIVPILEQPTKLISLNMQACHITSSVAELWLNFWAGRLQEIMFFFRIWTLVRPAQLGKTKLWPILGGPQPSSAPT